MTIAQRILAGTLTLVARVLLWRFRPVLVAITGNAGKTTTKEAIAAVLATRYRVRASGGNLNNELGIPTTIIGDFSDAYYRTGGTLFFWLRVIVTAKLMLFRSRASYPEVLVLEFGADRPGDIKKLVRSFPPHVAVITQVGEVPVHVEYFASPQELAAEKAQLLKHLQPADHAVLGADDLTVLDMRHRTHAHVHTFGLGEGADVRASDVRLRLDGSRPLGISFDIQSGGNTMPASITGTVGDGAARAAAAAVAVGAALGVGLADAVQALVALRPPPGRLRILDGIRSSIILDDSYNASPAAMHLAIDTVRHVPAMRHMLVLGDMLELGEHSIQAHQAIGSMAAEVADVLVCVGERGRFIADAAKNQMPVDHVYWVPNARTAAEQVQQLVRAGDVILVKGSQSMRMERIVQEIMAQPERAGELLVRQSARWLAKE